MAAGRKKQIGFSKLALFVGLAALCVYLVITLVSAQVEIVAKRRELDGLSKQINTQNAQISELQRTIETDDENSYYERLAREKLNYARPDERVFVDMSGN